MWKAMRKGMPGAVSVAVRGAVRGGLCLAGVVAGAGSGAWAQSSVTLYGALDAGLGRRHATAVSDWGFQSNFKDSSHWGVRGQEDLGGGLALRFDLQSGALDLGNGAVDGGGFSRQSWLGLSGGFGSVMLGRTTTPQSRVMGQFDLNGNTDASALKALGLSASGAFMGARRSGQLHYATPVLGGAQARVAYARRDGARAHEKDFVQVAVQFKAGGLSLGAAVQPRVYRPGHADYPDHRTGYALGARHDFGALVASAVFVRDESRKTGHGLGLGVAVPVGAFTVGAQAARIMGSTQPAWEGAAALELFANYRLSRRTQLYADHGRVNGRARQGRGLARRDSFGLGLFHEF